MIVKHEALDEFIPACGRKLADSGEIPILHGRRRLYHDPDDLPSPVLQYDVDFVPVLVAIMGEGAPLPAPGGDLSEFAEHEGFEDRAEPGLILLNHVRGDTAHRGEKAGIQEMKFWRFGQAFEPVREPRLQGVNQIETLEHADIFLRRDMIETDGRADPGVVDEVPGVFREHVKQFRHDRELPDLRDIADITLYDRVQIPVIPVLSARPFPSIESFGISSRKYDVDQVGTDDHVVRGGLRTGKGSINPVDRLKVSLRLIESQIPTN